MAAFFFTDYFFLQQLAGHGVASMQEWPSISPPALCIGQVAGSHFPFFMVQPISLHFAGSQGTILQQAAGSPFAWQGATSTFLASVLDFFLSTVASEALVTNTTKKTNNIRLPTPINNFFISNHFQFIDETKIQQKKDISC